MRKHILTIAMLCAAATVADAKVKLLPLFSDNMVLQQQTQAPLWGEAKPGKKVTVTTSWNHRQYTTKADANGRWRVDVSTPQAGGPYDVTLSDGQPTVLRNVMIGEVWLCTGQSNMEFPMEGWNIKVNADEIAQAALLKDVRLMHIDRSTSLTESSALPDQKHQWEQCTPETVKQFSATAYFFGKYLNQQRHVPVGLIMSCWGGTDIEPWISAKAIGTIPRYAADVEAARQAHLYTTEQLDARWQKELRQWMDAVGVKEGSRTASGEELWAQPQTDDSQWQTLAQPSIIDKVGYPNFDGFAWYRKTIDIPARWAGKELKIELGYVDDMDVTYFNGVEIGHHEKCLEHRNYTIPASAVKEGKAVIAVKTLDIGSAGGMRGNADNMRIGLEGDMMSLGGEWKLKTGASLYDIEKMPLRLTDNMNVPTALYNAMIHPLAPYAVKGAIWYQGENNAPYAARYNELLSTLIADWRGLWGKHFPFIFVQLANYMQRCDQPTQSEWAELREAQLKTLSVDSTAMAVIIDAGMADDIHPTDKATVGKRLGMAAQHLAYGMEQPWCSPLYESHTIEDGAIRIHFSHADGGLTTRNGDTLKGFAIAGPDRQFHWADAHIEGNTVVVKADDVPYPVAVRYAWADNPDCNLYNAAGLPASPFRTDQWPGLTINR